MRIVCEGRPAATRAELVADRLYFARDRSGLRFHDLRHSAATLLLAAGVPERVVMEILGHSTLVMVKRYEHVIPGLTAPQRSAWTG